MSLKEQIQTITQEMGFHSCVVASLEPMPGAQKEYERWLELGYAAGMDYLKRDPHFRTSPALLYPQARSALILSVSYYTQRAPRPADYYGDVALYAAGLDYHVVIKSKLRELTRRLEKELGKTIAAKAFTDDVALYEQALAARSGLGFAGKNTLIIGPKLSGSYNFVCELFLDIELDADRPYEGTCGNCFRCGTACPTSAIVAPGTVDSNKCISYLTIENKDGIALELRPQLKSWVFGCDICQEVCPYNQRPSQTPWKEFLPEAGVGHYLNLLDLLKIKSQEEFHQRFIKSAVRRPRLRGLLRNALIVLGNRTPEEALDDLVSFVLEESDPMLREHGAWAIAQYKTSKARQALEKISTLLK
jgi:epoxyqueuosine reductase